MNLQYQESIKQAQIAKRIHDRGKRLIMVDIDGTICKNPHDPKDPKAPQGGFVDAVPFPDRIEYINSLHDEGHYIMYWTARGCYDGTDYKAQTQEQLKNWGCRYSELNVFKPAYDVWIDDKAVGVNREKEEFEIFKSSVEYGIENS